MSACAEQLCLPDAPIRARARLHVKHDEDLEARIRYEVAKRRGRAQAIRAEDLAHLVGSSDRLVRLYVKTLIEEHGAMIGSATDAPPGFYWIATPEEQRQAAANLWHRAISCLVRISKLEETGLETLFGQLPLKYAELFPSDHNGDNGRG